MTSCCCRVKLNSGDREEKRKFVSVFFPTNEPCGFTWLKGLWLKDHHWLRWLCMLGLSRFKNTRKAKFLNTRTLGKNLKDICAILITLCHSVNKFMLGGIYFIWTLRHQSEIRGMFLVAPHGPPPWSHGWKSCGVWHPSTLSDGQSARSAIPSSIQSFGFQAVVELCFLICSLDNVCLDMFEGPHNLLSFPRRYCKCIWKKNKFFIKNK